MQNTGSIASENFIKTIYHFQLGAGKDTRPGSIAKELGITNAAATDMARKLSQKKLIEYEKYKALKLSKSGERMALNILRKHRLWETFLHQVLGLSMHEIHREAELLEHLTSDFLADKINDYLGNPATDPHGDPIPNVDGTISMDEKSFPLHEASVDQRYMVSRLSGSDKEFFDFCHSNKIFVGSKLNVNKQYSNNKMTEIEVDGARLILNDNFSNRIYIKKDN
ncbi:MAG: metal-dependent transcriptional regulator [Bacteroidales bacterium]|nr:metal-dependent transcriptional regulator [Bacteroidales bacterium]